MARSRDLRERLILPLEQLSYYVHLVLPGQTSELHNPVIHLHRKLVVAGSEYRILSRILDAGADHTGRSNHIAHHLIFEENERLGLPSPAIILLDWKGWKPRWEGPPAYIDEDPIGELKGLGEKFGKLEDISSAERDIAFARGWDTTFTTYLQEKDVKASFDWIGDRDGNKTDLNDDLPSSADVVIDYRLESPLGNKDLPDIVRQAAFLENLPAGQQTISAPGGDETKLLEVYAAALGLRIQKAQQEAFDRKLKAKRETLEIEYNEIVTLVSSLGKHIEEILKRCKLTEDRGRNCQEAERQPYDKFIESSITPVKGYANNTKSSISEIHNDAKREHDIAMRNIQDGRIPADGENTEQVKKLRVFDKEVQKKLSDQIALINNFKKQLDADQEKINRKFSYPENKEATVQLQSSKEATVQLPNNREEIGHDVSSGKDFDSKSPQQQKKGGRVFTVSELLHYLVYLVIGVLALVSFVVILGRGPAVITYEEPKETSFGIYFVLNEKDKAIYRVTDNASKAKELDWLELVNYYETSPQKKSLIGIRVEGVVSDPDFITDKSETYEISKGSAEYKKIKTIFDKALKSKKSAGNLDKEFNSIQEDIITGYYRDKLDKLKKKRSVVAADELIKEIKAEWPAFSKEASLSDILKEGEGFCSKEKAKRDAVREGIEGLKAPARKPSNLKALVVPGPAGPGYAKLHEYNKEILRQWKNDYVKLKESIDALATDFKDDESEALEDALEVWGVVLGAYLDAWGENYHKIKKGLGLTSEAEKQLKIWNNIWRYYYDHRKLLENFPSDYDWDKLPLDLGEYEAAARKEIDKLKKTIEEKDDKELIEIKGIYSSYRGLTRVEIMNIINTSNPKIIYKENQNKMTLIGRGFKGGDVILEFKSINNKGWVVQGFQLPGSN